ncbi:S49 family peptidase [Shewanella algae]|uniref:S49 family peptidase n=1 Tax=Shewanella algae TaxID=38313 RepID=UPI001AAD2CC5|nr:S49 family peptidase [Shewanella algae]MBO2656152.1 S49 family peptidase [Shewanella algae]
MDKNAEHELLSVAKDILKVYKRTTYGKVGLLAFVIALGLATNLINNFNVEAQHIAVVNINGELGGGFNDNETSSGNTIAAKIVEALNNKKSSMLVINADSPGGSPTDSQVIAETLIEYKLARGELSPKLQGEIQTKLNAAFPNFEEHPTTSEALSGDLSRKPIVAVVGKQCASACVQAIIHADYIVAQRASMFGNIGVRIDSLNWSSLAEKLGVTNVTLTSGENKDMLNPWRPLNNEQMQLANSTLLQPVFNQFKKDVKTGRNGKLKITDDVLFTGLVWTGEQSKELGLVDATSNGVKVQRALESWAGVKYKAYTHKQFSLSSFLVSKLGITW